VLLFFGVPAKSSVPSFPSSERVINIVVPTLQKHRRNPDFLSEFHRSLRSTVLRFFFRRICRPEPEYGELSFQEFPYLMEAGR
jgi:hypothetical protein